MNGMLTSPLYDPAFFVNRVTEINFVHAVIDKLVSGKSVDRRTIQFEGLRGGGKSWLAFHLHRKELGGRMDVKTLLFAFDIHNEELKKKDEWHYSAYIGKKGTGIVPDEFATSILRFACQQLSATNVENASLEERITWLVRCIKESQPDRGFVFIFDSISELDPPLIEKLESVFLASIAELSNVLVILTGRPPQPLWSSVRLRFQVNSIFLEPLSQESLTEALRRRSKGNRIDIERIAERVYPESMGNPGAFMRLAVSDELSAILNDMLSMYAEDQRAKARTAIEALCVLMVGFREEEIIVMLAAYGLPVSASDARSYREFLQDRQVLSWSVVKRGFVLDESLGGMAAEYLRKGKPEIWVRLHEKAALMYEGYAQTSPKWKAVYLENAAQHRRALDDILTDTRDSDIPPQSNDTIGNTASYSRAPLTTL